MRRLTTQTLCVLSVFVLAGIGLAACGDDSNDTAATKSTTTSTTEAAAGGGAAVVKVTDNDKFGKILTDGQGNTLYVFLKDTGTTSTCTDACADLWPALTATGTPTGDGVDAEDLGTTTRPDGTTQVTFYGHPRLHLRRRCQGRRHDGSGRGKHLVRRRHRGQRRQGRRVGWLRDDHHPEVRLLIRRPVSAGG